MLHRAFLSRSWVYPRSSSWSWLPWKAFSSIPEIALHGYSSKPRSLPQRRNGEVVNFQPQRFLTSVPGYESTIFALSTAPGRAAIAIVRISGLACLDIFHALCPETLPPKPRVASLRTLYDPRKLPSNGTILDFKALVLYFPGPRTATGEDILELHLHGGPAVVRAVLAAIGNCSGLEHPVRYAEPGEFTRRAFINGQLDLTQVEALGDTLAADTEQQRRIAIRGSSNALAKRFEKWRKELLYARGELEALIDFAEDQHFDESPRELIESVAFKVGTLQRRIELHIQNASKGELLRSGIKVALLGAPNAGKSSLLNRIVGREASIVSVEEGTTRDIVDVGVDIGGWYCKLGDMAGLRSESSSGCASEPGGKLVTISAIEKEGIRRAKARALESDVAIVVLSLECGCHDINYELSVDPEVMDVVKRCQQIGKRIIVVINKSDRLPPAYRDEVGKTPRSLVDRVRDSFPDLPDNCIYNISCKEAQEDSSSAGDPGNIQTFLAGLISNLQQITTPVDDDGGNSQLNDKCYWEEALGITERQQSNLHRCIQHLANFMMLTQPNAYIRTHSRTNAYAHLHNDANTHTYANTQLELTSHLSKTPCDANATEVESLIDIVTAAEHLRFAADSLAKITGKGDGADVEDVLGVVFEKFCVGK